jgi:glycosyltransferase involved in cell wall biosynthesis
MWEQEIGHLDTALGEAARKRIRLVGYAEKGDLPFLYAGAMLLAFPSLYEGFGLPPLEAMSAGCPVLTSDIAPLHEVCGEAALYVDPYSPSSIRAGLEKLAGEAALRASLAASGDVQAARFTPAAFQERLGEAYACATG